MQYHRLLCMWLFFHLKSHKGMHTIKKGKKQKYHTFGTVSKPNRKIVERGNIVEKGKINTP